MFKSTRSYGFERARDASNGAIVGTALALVFRENQTALVWILIVFLVLNIAFSILYQRQNPQQLIDEKMDALRFRGLIPTDRALVDEDIKRLQMAGEEELAAILYQTLHGGTFREARRAVKSL